MMASTESMLDISQTGLGNHLAQPAASADDRVRAQALAATGNEHVERSQFLTDELEALRRDQATFAPSAGSYWLCSEQQWIT